MWLEQPTQVPPRWRSAAFARNVDLVRAHLHPICQPRDARRSYGREHFHIVAIAGPLEAPKIISRDATEVAYASLAGARTWSSARGCRHPGRTPIGQPLTVGLRRGSRCALLDWRCAARDRQLFLALVASAILGDTARRPVPQDAAQLRGDRSGRCKRARRTERRSTTSADLSTSSTSASFGWILSSTCCAPIERPTGCFGSTQRPAARRSLMEIVLDHRVEEAARTAARERLGDGRDVIGRRRWAPRSSIRFRASAGGRRCG